MKSTHWRRVFGKRARCSLEADVDDLYRQQIIDRYKHPLKRGVLDPHDITFEDENPLCGDRLRIDLRVGPDGRITQAAFSGDGCAISQASADLLLEYIEGKPLEDVRALSKEDILELLGIELSPIRLKCALLSLKVLKAGAYGMKDLNEAE
jgi:nitrogen fixation NifU-like protein